MRIFVSILGGLFLLIGVLTTVAVVIASPSGDNAISGTSQCSTDAEGQGSARETCSFDADDKNSENLTAILAGVGLTLSGAVMLGAGAVASRPRQAPVMPQQMPPPYPHA